MLGAVQEAMRDGDGETCVGLAVGVLDDGESERRRERWAGYVKPLRVRADKVAFCEGEISAQVRHSGSDRFAPRIKIYGTGGLSGTVLGARDGGNGWEACMYVRWVGCIQDAVER
jgi:hypothetical protein